MLNQKTLLLCVLALSIVPAFVNTTSLKINLLSVIFDSYPQVYFMQGINIHIGNLLNFAVLACLPFLFLLRWFIPKLTFPDIFVILIGFFMSTAVIAGVVVGANSPNIAFYLQTLSPIAMYFLGAHLVRDVNLFRSIPRGFIALNTATLFFMLLFIWFNGLMSGDVGVAAYNLGLAFPAAKDLYPPIYFMSLFFIVYVFCREGKYSIKAFIYLPMAFMHVVFMYYLWSRSAFAGAAVGTALIFFFELRKSAKIQSRVAALGQYMTIFAIVVAVVSSAFLLTTIGILAERHRDESILQESDAMRRELAFEALERISASPIFGDMFMPVLDVKVGDVEKLDVMRLFPAHNQYLDYALRGGVQSATLLIILVIWGISEGLRTYPAGRLAGDIDILRRYLGAIMAMVAVGSLFQLYFVQNIPASAVWFFLGILARLRRERKKSIVFHRKAFPGQSCEAQHQRSGCPAPPFS